MNFHAEYVLLKAGGALQIGFSDKLWYDICAWFVVRRLHGGVSMEIGGIITFGNYEWQVLDKKDNAVLIITRYIIEEHAYNDKYIDITWAECSLRKYLGGDFYNRFSVAEKSRIIPVTNMNYDNQWYGTRGGADTQDMIFLLSIE